MILSILLFFFQPQSCHASNRAHFDKVMTIVLENANYSDVVQQPVFSALASKGALFTQFMAETHPSQPNYIAMTSGGTQGVLTDGSVDLGAKNIVDLLESAGKSWKVYAEDYPGNCFLGSSSGKYARKHVPFLSYTDITKSPSRCAKIVDAGMLDADIATDSLPDYSFYVPNLDDDGHDTSVDASAQWFSSAFGPRLADPKFMKGMLLVITYDESESFFGANQVFTVMIGESVLLGAQVSARVNHYSILSLIESEFSLGSLGGGDTHAAPIAGIWK